MLGGAYMGTLAGLNTSVQIHAPREVRSRILALYTLSLSLCYPVGALVQADLARIFGVRPVTLAAALCLALALGITRVVVPGFWPAMGVPAATNPLLLAD